MAEQLTAHAVSDVAGATASALVDWRAYGWVYLFAAAIGFSTTVAEPALIAVSLKAGEVSGATLNPWGLRVAVAIGVAFGELGCREHGLDGIVVTCWNWIELMVMAAATLQWLR